jgi:Beta-propeller repeat
MRTSKSVLSQTVNRLFGTPRATQSRRKPGCRPRALGHGFERLEERTVLSVSLGSAMSIGNDTGGSAAADVATDQAGNTYLTGSFSGTVDFDPAAAHPGDTDILTSRGSGDAFVAKYAPDDSLVWVRRMGGDASDSGGRVAVDASGNVYVAGTFRGSADFGSTTLSTAGDSDGFVTKLNSGGTIQWAKSWGTTGDDTARGVGVDAAGNVYALGTRFQDGYDVLKFNSTGRMVWSESFATHDSWSGGDLAVDAAGNAFVVGAFSGTVDFDPGPKTHLVSSGQPTNSAYTSAFTLKLDTKGKFAWVSPFVGQAAGSDSGVAFAKSVALDGSGNVIVGGTYLNAVDFNPGSGMTVLPNDGGFIAKLNGSGGLVWARALESIGSTFVNGLAVDSAGSIYATGSFFGTVDFDPGAGVDSQTTAGSGDVFVVKLTAAGNLNWAEAFGGTGVDAAHGIAVDSAGTVFLAGFYNGTVDFDPDPLAVYNLTAPGTFNNGFRLRLRQA